MLTTITDHIVFSNVEPATLFELYTDGKKHQAFTGAPAIISSKTGEPFNVYGGYCFGSNLHIEENKLIVQSWKAQGWKEESEYSLVSLRLVKDKSDTHIFLTHADIPTDKAESMLKGWEEWYWVPLRKFLSANRN